MWYPAVVTDGADTEPVTLPEAKKQVHVEYHTDDDAYIERLISAAREHVEAYCGTRIPEQIVAVKCDSFADFAWLPVVPVQSIGIQYVDIDGATQTLSTDVYELRADDLDASIVLKFGQSWPSIQKGSRITVTAVVGYSTTPQAVRQAILVLVSEWFETREISKSDGRTVLDDLLTNFRR
jgi:uncharacterized phiE125 gp8 family phage protein